MPVTETAQTINRIEINLEVAIAAPPARVYDALISDTAAWWGPPYAMLEKPTDIILEPAIGGRFYETDSHGNGCLWGTVQRLAKDQILEIRGPIGMSAPVSAVVCFELVPAGAGTTVKFTHMAVGPVTAETQSGYTMGWNELIGDRLKSFIETGERKGVKG